MTRSRTTFATIDAAAMAALRASPSTTARCGGADGPSRKPSTRHASAGGYRSREHGTQPGEIRAMEAVPIDRTDGHDPDADRGRARSDGLVQHLALLDRDLLRVVQRGERPDARAAQRVVVEEHAGDDERPRERAASRLVRARDEAHAELAIESEEALAAGSSHAAESTS